MTHPGPDSHHPTLCFGLDCADDGAQELFSSPVISCGAWAAAHAVLGGLCPGSGLDGCYEVGKTFEQAGGAEVVDHVEQRHFYAVGESVVVGELDSEVCLKSGEDGGELCVDGLLGECEGGWSFVERGGSTHGHGIDASVFRGDLLWGGGAGADDKGKRLGGFGVGQHEPYSNGYFAYSVAIHPRHAAFELF